MTTRFGAHLIVTKAYKLFDKGGLSNLKIYSITRACHCSSTPIYYTFKSQKGLQKEVLRIAYHEFEKNLEKNIVEKNVDLKEHEPYWYFYHVLKKQPGLVQEISINNGEIIEVLAEIAQKYFKDSLLATLRANILLVGVALNLKKATKTNGSFLTFSQTIENLLRNLKNNVTEI